MQREQKLIVLDYTRAWHKFTKMFMFIKVGIHNRFLFQARLK